MQPGQNIPDHPRVRVGGIETARLSLQDMITQMVADCTHARLAMRHHPKLIFTSNGHAIALAATDMSFRALLDKADMIHADGQPVVLASRWLTKTPIPERSATTDFIHDAARAAQEHGLRFFLLGSSEEINARAEATLQKAYPDLIIAGRRNGYFRQDEEQKICEQINQSRADIVWVGLGVPLEQEFCVRNQHHLSAGWLITCGGCFHYITGDYSRAPQGMQKYGLEWLYRLYCEPGRLWRRYALTNPIAMFKILTDTRAISQKSA